MSSETGTFNSGDVLNIVDFYEMSIFTDYNLSLPLPEILCSNDAITWVKYDNLKSNYMYLSELMANKLKVVSDNSMVLHFNANFKK